MTWKGEKHDMGDRETRVRMGEEKGENTFDSIEQ
jgi:hypothetical protein